MPDLAPLRTGGANHSSRNAFLGLFENLNSSCSYMIPICHFMVSRQFRFRKPLQEGRGILPLPLFNLVLPCKLNSSWPYVIPICHFMVSRQFLFRKPLQEGRAYYPSRYIIWYLRVNGIVFDHIWSLYAIWWFLDSSTSRIRLRRGVTNYPSQRRDGLSLPFQPHLTGLTTKYDCT